MHIKNLSARKLLLFCAVLAFQFFSLVISNEKEIYFHVYNRDFSNDAEVVKSLKDSKIFCKDKHSKILVHGFGANCTLEFAIPNKNAFLKMIDCNVICVDWSVDAKYLGIATKQVLSTAEFIFNDFEKIIVPENVHFLGHSLGAQISGVIGHFYRNLKNTQIGQITALDPASLNMFYVKYNTTKLAPESAKTVDVIHTEIKFVGYPEPHGHYDFYPNGGCDQPGCQRSLACSHSRSHQILTRLILNPLAYPAKKCESLDLVKKNSCYDSNGVYMGNIETYKEPGLYYVDTPDFNDPIDLGSEPLTKHEILKTNDWFTTEIEHEMNHNDQEEKTDKLSKKSNIQKHSTIPETDSNDRSDLNSAGQMFTVKFIVYTVIFLLFLMKVLF